MVEVLVDKLETKKTRLSVNSSSSSRIAKLPLPQLCRDAGASRGFPSGRRGFFFFVLVGVGGELTSLAGLAISAKLGIDILKEV